jgi:hypothetical protein
MLQGMHISQGLLLLFIWCSMFLMNSLASY